MNRFVKVSIWVLAAVLVSGAALAVDRMDPIALKNWDVPSIASVVRTWGDSPNTHFVNPGAFIFQSTVPCRVVDTRGGPGPFAAGETRTYSMEFGGLCPSTFPSNIAAVSLNITVTQTAGTGFVTGYATGGTLPTVSNVTWIGAGVTISNAAIIPTAGGAASNINIYASQATQIIIDINGIFIANISANADNLVITTNKGSAAAIVGINDIAAGSIGVSGTGFFRGTQGNGTDNTNSCGVCGDAASGGTGASGVSAFPNGGTFAALFTTGNFVALGTKSFVEPNAADPSTQINYISLEGPEARTFITGRSRFVGGLATIDLPEHFRLITDEEGLTVQVTPIGKMTSIAVVDVNINQIQVQSTRDVEFFYTVTGVRSAFRNHQPVEQNSIFRPDGGGGTHDIRTDLSPAAKAAMIKNGSLNPDGSWSAETAQRLGWKAPADAK